jgi:hypothetical protein
MPPTPHVQNRKRVSEGAEQQVVRHCKLMAAEGQMKGSGEQNMKCKMKCKMPFFFFFFTFSRQPSRLASDCTLMMDLRFGNCERQNVKIKIEPNYAGNANDNEKANDGIRTGWKTCECGGAGQEMSVGLEFDDEGCRTIRVSGRMKVSLRAVCNQICTSASLLARSEDNRGLGKLNVNESVRSVVDGGSKADWTDRDGIR